MPAFSGAAPCGILQVEAAAVRLQSARVPAGSKLTPWDGCPVHSPQAHYRDWGRMQFARSVLVLHNMVRLLLPPNRAPADKLGAARLARPAPAPVP